tara:strand:+ start:575 stop:1135 length:561 start_codon:yes stop_codon:yes gene_type:complete
MAYPNDVPPEEVVVERAKAAREYVANLVLDKKSKILKSKLHDFGYWKPSIDLAGKWKEIKFPIRPIPLEDLWCSVPRADVHRGKVFLPEVKKSIQENGMLFPIMACYAEYKELQRQKDIWQGKICQLPFWSVEEGRQWTVWGGSNRVIIARELGYTHIDTAIMPTLECAHQLQKVMRQPFEDRWYQ